MTEPIISATSKFVFAGGSGSGAGYHDGSCNGGGIGYGQGSGYGRHDGTSGPSSAFEAFSGGGYGDGSGHGDGLCF